jgi:hypothetical protein
MRSLFDRLVCDPDERHLSDIGWDACERTDFPLRARLWSPILHAVISRPEGQSLLRPPQYSYSARGCYVAVAWWSDHQGRKHVRVTAGDVAWPGPHRHYSRLDEDERPPLWHICPERVYRVQRGDATPAWLACCACGEAGTPRHLAWMGDCCGPCHDRREEGAPLQVAEPPSTLRQPGPICGLAFDRAGGRLAVSLGRIIYVYDLQTGAPTVLHGGWDEDDDQEIRPLAFSPDGELLAGSDLERSCILLWRAGVPQDTLNMMMDPAPVELAFSPDGRWLAFRNPAGELRVWDRREDSVTPISLRATAIDFAPGGRTLAVASRSGVVQVEAGSWRPGSRLLADALDDDEDILFLKYTPNGEHLVFVTGYEDPHPGRNSWVLRLRDVRLEHEIRRRPIPFASNLEMTPDGRYLARVVHDDQHSPAAVHFWDLQSWRPAGWLEWDPEDDLRDLAFSPDGRTMATGSASGVVKLWPWRRLLEG